MRLMLLGDTHGSARWIGRGAALARELELDGILQVGDFGFMPSDRWHRDFLGVSERLLAAAGIVLWFIRGNHDDPRALRSLARSSCRDRIGAVMVSPHVRFVPCGTTWDWDGMRFGALGGAVSVNRDELVEDETWWADELVCEHALARLCAGPVDVLVAHDAPMSSLTIWNRYVGSESVMQPICETQRTLVDRAMRETRAPLVVHGHHHVGYDETIRWATDVDATASPTGWVESRVVGLACESWESIAVLETADGSVSRPCPDAALRSRVSTGDPWLRGSLFEERRDAAEEQRVPACVA